MTGYTPGPWVNEEETKIIWSKNMYDSAINAVGCIVARVAGPPNFKAYRPTVAEQYANAQLISAAPEMLDALKLALPMLDDNYRWHRDTQSAAGNVSHAYAALTAARNAIDKAEGR